MIEHQIDLGSWRQGRQLLKKLHRLEEEIRRAVAPGALEFQANPPVGQTAETVLGQWRPEDVAT